jgi:hypothetical protein
MRSRDVQSAELGALNNEVYMHTVIPNLIRLGLIAERTDRYQLGISPAAPLPGRAPLSMKRRQGRRHAADAPPSVPLTRR